MQDEAEIYKVATASTDGIVVNSHFGKAGRFYIYQVWDGETQLVEERKVQPVCDHGDHDEERLVENCRALADCRYILVSRIGYRAAGILEQMGVTPMEIPDLIPAALDRVNAYDPVQRLFD